MVSRSVRGVLAAVLAVGALAGCGSTDTGPDPTTPPSPPTHRIASSVLPVRVAGYTAYGPTPTADTTQVTYRLDSNPLNLAVVSFDPTGEFGKTTLSNQAWYGESRCGVLWYGDSNATPRPIQAACITVLTDGVMTVVAGGDQTPTDLAGLANAIAAGLAS